MNPHRPKMMTTLQFRCTFQEKNQIRARASFYSGDNMSMFMIRQALQAPAEVLVGPRYDRKKPKIKRP